MWQLTLHGLHTPIYNEIEVFFSLFGDVHCKVLLKNTAHASNFILKFSVKECQLTNQTTAHMVSLCQLRHLKLHKVLIADMGHDFCLHNTFIVGIVLL